MSQWWRDGPDRSQDEEAEVNELLRHYDRIVDRLFELRVNIYRRCVCPWSEPHAERCPLYWRER